MTKNKTFAQAEEISSSPIHDYSHLPFKPISMLAAGGHLRQIVLVWLLICAFTIPSAILTRRFEWTGIPLDVAGITVHLSIYLPLIICIPLVLWMGFLWGAIPAYFSTFVVALYGDLPFYWAIVFSFANPLGLAMYSMVYRVTSLPIVIRTLPAIIGFCFVSLLSAFTGSVGSFIWTYTIDRGINETYPVWQGWWLGGWLQALLIVAPLMFLFGEKILKTIDAPKAKFESIEDWRGKFFMALILGLLVLISYVLIARMFSIAGTEAALQGLSNEVVRLEVLNAIDSLTYPIFVLLGAVIVCCYFVYRAVHFWTDQLIKANDELANSNSQLAKLATTDVLTNIANRRSIMDSINKMYSRSLREELPLSIIMVDVDHFKRVNDVYGHIAGDAVLQQISHRMQQQLRDYDQIGRYGGEEFMVVLPNSKIDSAMVIAERIKSAISEVPMQTSEGLLNITISLGVAELSVSDGTVTTFVNRADQALLEAKDQGRNRIVVASGKPRYSA